MAKLTEEKIYTLLFDEGELNKLNNGELFEIKFNGSKVIIKRAGISY